MFISRATLFDDNDVNVEFNLNVRRKGLLELVTCDWSDLNVEYVGPRKDAEIIGIKVAKGFSAGYATSPISIPDITIYHTAKAMYWPSISFEKSAEIEINYHANVLFMALGSIAIEGKHRGLTKTANLFIIDQEIYYQHGDTESWGSSNKKDLFFPWQNLRL